MKSLPARSDSTGGKGCSDWRTAERTYGDIVTELSPPLSLLSHVPYCQSLLSHVPHCQSLLSHVPGHKRLRHVWGIEPSSLVPSCGRCVGAPWPLLGKWNVSSLPSVTDRPLPGPGFSHASKQSLCGCCWEGPGDGLVHPSSGLTGKVLTHKWIFRIFSRVQGFYLYCQNKDYYILE